MTPTTEKRPTITRFTAELLELPGPVPVLIPWSEVTDGDIALMDGELTVITGVRVRLDEWGDGSSFIRADIGTVRDNGSPSCQERKGDLLACVMRTPGIDAPLMTEAWVAWMQDMTVEHRDRCWCYASRFGPHPRTAEHGHPEGPAS
jgi:hypothetical protein